jgi:putative membrane protein
MTRNTIASLTLAASMTLAGGALARDPGGQSGSRQGGAVAEERDRAAGDRNAERGQQNNMPGQDVQGQGDQAKLAALRQIAQSPEQAGDRLFVLGAACGNLFEVEMSNAVAQRAQDQKVKELARMIARDHEQANQQLRTVAQSLQVQLPTSISAEERAKIDIINSLPPEQVEMMYVSKAKMAHAAQLTGYSDAAQTLKDPQARQYAEQTLPKIRQHTQMILEVAEAKGLSGDFGFASGVGGVDGLRRGDRAGDRMGERTDDRTGDRLGDRAGERDGTNNPNRDRFDDRDRTNQRDATTQPSRTGVRGTQDDTTGPGDGTTTGGQPRDDGNR